MVQYTPKRCLFSFLLDGFSSLAERKSEWRLLFGLGVLFCSILLQSSTAVAAPKFDHTPPAFGVQGKIILITGKIEENDDMEDVFLRYRKVGAKNFHSIKMSLSLGIKYSARIPIQHVQPPYLEYFVLGQDVDKKWLNLFASEASPKKLLIRLGNKPLVRKRSQPTSLKGAGATSQKNKGNLSEENSEEPDSWEKKLEEESKVISATRKEQRIQKAPAVVTVITQSEIEDGGWRNLVELLRFTAGIDVNWNGLSSHDLGIRGVNPRLAFGDKLLLLLDGHSMSWRQLNRNSATLNIDMIKRIEIIRGPGSSLWGANALSGVINIITKTRQDLKGVSGVLGGSPLSRSYFLSLQGGQEVLKGVTFRASFSVTKEDRSPILSPVYEFNQKQFGNIKYFQKGDQEYNQYFYSQISWGGLSLSFYQNRYDAGGPFSSFSGGVGGKDTRFLAERYITKLSWLGSIFSNGTITAWISFDHYGFIPGTAYEENGFSSSPSVSALNGGSGYYALYVPKIDPKTNKPVIDPKTKKPVLRFGGFFPDCRAVGGKKVPCAKPVGVGVCAIQNVPSKVVGACRQTYTNGRFLRTMAGTDNRLEIGTQLSLPIGESLFLMLGLEFEYLDSTQIYFPDIWPLITKKGPPKATNVHFSLFSQAQYNVRDFLEVTGGFRIDFDQSYGWVLTPRAAAVFSPGKGVYAKLLYGNAFKSPSFNDLFYFRKDKIYGNPTLKPESVNTFELQVGWSKRSLITVSVNGYLSFFRDLITYEARKGAGAFQDTKESAFEEKQKPSENAVYVQKTNGKSLNSYGLEFEIRLSPIRNLKISASFGAFQGKDEAGKSLDYAARLRGAFNLSYRIPSKIPIQFAVGALFVGSKTVPSKGFKAAGQLPSSGTNQEKNVDVPSWTADKDPGIATPSYVQTYASLQFLNIMKHIDVVFRFNNLLNTDMYDANEIIFRPRTRFDLVGFLRIHY